MPIGRDDAEGPPPRLLKTLPPWHPGAWALPATTLSLVAILLGTVVAVYLQRSLLLQALFRLPFHPSLLAAPVAGLACLVAVRCRHRPGGLLPRCYTLAIALVAAAVAIWASADTYFVPRGRPFVHALTTAMTFATVILALRLVKVRPHGWLVHNLALVGLLVTLIVGIPMVRWVEGRVVDAEVSRLDQHRRELIDLAAALREVKDFKWSELEKDLAGGGVQLERLKSLDIPEWLGDPYVWDAASLVNEDTPLLAAASSVMDEMRDSVVAASAPRLLAAEYTYNPDTKRWDTYTDFGNAAALTTSYYRELTRLHARVAERLQPLEAQKAPALVEHQRSRAAEISAWTKASGDSWTGRWLTPVTPGGGTPPSLLETLRLRLPIGDELSATRAAHLGALMSLSKSDAEKLANGACEDYDYAESYFAYYRVDCHAYSLRADQSRPSLQVQLRVVYQAPRYEGIHPWTKPHQLYYLFPVPQASPGGVEGYRQQAMQALFDVVSELHNPKPRTRRGSLPTEGFWLDVNRETFQVTRPEAVRGLGLNAVEVQVFAAR